MKSTSPAGRTSRRAELARQLLELFEEAAERTGCREVHLDLAGRVVRLRFAGPEMRERLLPALAHLRTDPADPDLTLQVWDSRSTSTPAPVTPWSPDDFRERGVIRGYYGDGFYTVYEWETRALNVVDAAGGQGFFWIRDSEGIGLRQSGAPLRTALNLWLRGGDTQLLHSAAVGTPDGCVLLVGPSGAGKSSTALSCLGSGLGLIGEDYCMVTAGRPPDVRSIYSSAKLTPDALDRLPHLHRLPVRKPRPGEDGKAMIDLAASASDSLLRRAPLAGIAVLRISPGREETVARRSTPGATLASVAPSTMLQLPGNDAAMWTWLTDLVKSVPSHRLELGSDPSLIPEAIEGLLAA